MHQGPECCNSSLKRGTKPLFRDPFYPLLLHAKGDQASPCPTPLWSQQHPTTSEAALPLGKPAPAAGGLTVRPSRPGEEPAEPEQRPIPPRPRARTGLRHRLLSGNRGESGTRARGELTHDGPWGSALPRRLPLQAAL